MSIQRRVATGASLVLWFAASAATAATAAPPRGRGAALEQCVDAFRASASLLMLQLADRVGLDRDARDEMMCETVHPWRAAGVNVRWSTGEPETTSAEHAGNRERGAAHASIILTRETRQHPQRRSASSARRLASILFVAGKPTTLITAYPIEVRRLVDVVRQGDKSLAEFPGMRDRLVGRVLGRALAHELGHLLFASAEHAPSGLMRPTHRVDFLLAPSRDAFQVVVPPSLGCGVVVEDD